MAEGSLSRWAAIIVFPLFTISTVLVACFGQNIGANGDRILTTLASTQAAIFAIVFSIVILGVQLSASRYSPRLVSLFRNNSAYKFIIGLFFVSIGLDTLGLYLFSGQSTILYEIYLSAAGAFAVGSLAILYLFVDQTLHLSMPEGLLSRIRDQLSPKWTIQQAQKSQEDSLQRDPYQLLVSTIDSAIEERDTLTVNQGLDVISDRLTDLLTSTSLETANEASAVHGSVKNLCMNRLPGLIEHTTEKSQANESKSVIECIDDIGKAGINEEIEWAAKYSSQGLSKPVGSLGFSKPEDSVRKEAIDTNRTLLTQTAEAALWTATDHGVRFLGWQAAQSMRSRPSQHTRNVGYDSVAILSMPSILSDTTDELSVRTDDTEVNWLRGKDSQFNDLSYRENTLRGCYFAMCELTSAAIRYEIRTGTSMVNWQSIGGGWRNCLNNIEQYGSESCLDLWLGTVLYLEYIYRQTDEDVMTGFNNIIHLVCTGEQVDRAINSGSNGNINPKMKIDFIPGLVDPVEHPITGYTSPPVSDTDISFREWLESQQGMRGRGGFV